MGIYGTGENWTGGLMADYWQLTDYTLTEDSLPYARQPRAFFNWDKPLLPWLEAGVYTEAVRFTHDDNRRKIVDGDGEYLRSGVVDPRFNGSRLDIKPYVSLPFSGRRGT